MKCISVVCVILVVIVCVHHESGYALPASGNGTNKFDFGTGPSTPGKKNNFETFMW